MGYLPQFLVNVDEYNESARTANIFYGKDEDICPYVLDKAPPLDGDVTIKGTRYLHIDTEFTRQVNILRDYFKEHEIEYYEFGG